MVKFQFYILPALAETGKTYAKTLEPDSICTISRQNGNIRGYINKKKPDTGLPNRTPLDRTGNPVTWDE